MGSYICLVIALPARSVPERAASYSWPTGGNFTDLIAQICLAFCPE